jgi:hypothetical protein
MMRFVNLGRLAALLLLGVGLGGTPAAAGGCGWGCWAPTPVVVQPVYVSPCSCCGCGASYYGSYYPAYAYPAVGAYSIGLAPVAASGPFYAPRVAPRYWGSRYWGPRRGLMVARY